jgi:hypothetical protein
LPSNFEFEISELETASSEMRKCRAVLTSASLGRLHRSAPTYLISCSIDFFFALTLSTPPTIRHTNNQAWRGPPAVKATFKVKKKRLVARRQPSAESLDLLTDAMMKLTLREKQDTFSFLNLPDELQKSVLDYVRLHTPCQSGFMFTDGV